MFRRNIWFPYSGLKSKAREKEPARNNKRAEPPGILLGLLFNPEDGGNIFLLNKGTPRSYTALQPRRPHSS
jgi:hypothetical protein